MCSPPADGEPAAACFAGCGLCVAEAVEDDAAQPAAREVGTARSEVRRSALPGNSAVHTIIDAGATPKGSNSSSPGATPWVIYRNRRGALKGPKLIHCCALSGLPMTRIIPVPGRSTNYLRALARSLLGESVTVSAARDASLLTGRAPGVVEPPDRLALAVERVRDAPAKPAARISRATRLRPTRMPRSRSSACTARGTPYVPRVHAWITCSSLLRTASVRTRSEAGRSDHA